MAARSRPDRDGPQNIRELIGTGFEWLRGADPTATGFFGKAFKKLGNLEWLRGANQTTTLSFSATFWIVSYIREAARSPPDRDMHQLDGLDHARMLRDAAWGAPDHDNIKAFVCQVAIDEQSLATRNPGGTGTASGVSSFRGSGSFGVWPGGILRSRRTRRSYSQGCDGLLRALTRGSYEGPPRDPSVADARNSLDKCGRQRVEGSAGSSELMVRPGAVEV